jgi:predicted CXXCH cytochrome family protein
MSASVISQTCSTCHATHQATTSTGLFRGYGASSGELPLCYSCHDGSGSTANIKSGPDSFGLTSGHVLEGLEGTSTPADLTNACSSCHAAHGDYTSRPDLPALQVNGVAISSTGNAWCLACHNDTQDWYATKGTYPSLSSPTKDASGYPVAGTFPGAGVYSDKTKNAHVLIPASSGATTRTAGDCLYCHAAHGSTAPYDALLANFSPSTSQTVSADRSTGAYAAACFTCHGGGSWEASGAVDIKRNATYDATGTSLGSSGGHRIKSSGGTLPTNAPLPCYDCHNPHGSSRGNGKLISDTLGASLDTSAGPAAVRQFCFTCHTSSDGFGWESVTATYTIPAATATVEGLKRDGGTFGSGPDFGQNWLRLRPTSGHLSTDTSKSCYDCHGSDYSKASGNNVHDPLSYDAAAHVAPAVSCTATGCHAGAGSLVALHSNATTTVAGVTRTSCQVCHADGTPASGACSACHNVDAPHGDDVARHTANLGALTSIEYHGGTLAVNQDCVSCHGSSSLLALHARDCSLCHSGSDPRASFTTWNKGCQQGACHPSIHQNESTGHVGGDACPDCHGDYSGNPPPVIPCTDCHATGPDTTPPTTVSNALASYVGPASIALTATDDRAVKDTYYRLDGGATSTVSAGAVYVASPASGIQSHTLEFWSIDWAGNVESPHNAGPFTLSADTQPPVTTSDAKATYAGPVTILLTATDNATNRGVRTTYFRFDSGVTQTGTTATLPQPASGMETHTIYFWSVDYAGNTEAENSATFTVYNDSVAPTTTSNLLPAPKYYPGAGNPGKVIIDLYPTDPAPSSGTAGVHVDSTNASTWWGDGHEAGWNQSVGAYQLGMWVFTSGDYPVTWYASDNAGNVEAPKTTVIKVDAERPVTTSNAVSGHTYQGDQTFTLSATDAGGSGVADTHWRLDGSAWTTGTAIPVPAPASGTASHSISYYSRDNAGNQEFPGYVSFNVQPGS